LWDAPALKSASSLYPFTIEGTSSTKAYIKNAGYKNETYVSRITWGTDGEYAIPITTIKKGETVEIDVKKLRDEQIPDARGRTIPLNISKGQINWLLRRSDATKEEALANKVPLVGQALQVDSVKGIHYSYFCLSCCEYSAYSYATLVPSNAQAVHPISFQYQILETGIDCYGNGIYGEDITKLGYDWSSTNTSVATVVNSGRNEGYATTQGGGQTEIKARVNIPIYFYYGTDCDGGGGPYFAGINDSGEICNEGERSLRTKDTQSVSFSKIAFKKESEPVTPRRLEDCACMTISPTSTLTANLKVYQVIIKRDGQPVTASNNTTIVGERINLTAEVIPSSTLSNHSWTIPSTAVKDFVVSADHSQGNKVDVDGLNTAGVSFVWVDGGGVNVEDFTTKEVIYRVTANGLQLEGRAAFKVKRPVVSLVADTSTTNFLITPSANGNNYKLIFGNDSNPNNIIDGIKFRNTISPMFPTNFGGTTQWVQIANHSSRNFVFNGAAEIAENPPSGLDGCYPYTLPRGRGITEDSPFIGFEGLVTTSDTATLNTNDNYTMWLMFQPNSPGAAWVPLKKVNWSWNAQATLSNGNWTHSGNNSPNPMFENTTDFPTWTSVVADRTGHCPP
jgi:hypothetical protein